MPEGKGWKIRTWSAGELQICGLHFLGFCQFNRVTEPLLIHTHENCYEFICLLKGQDTYFVENKSYPMRGGDVFVSFPGQAHSSGESHQGIGEYVWLQINPFVQEDFLGLSPENTRIVKNAMLGWDSHFLTPAKEVMQQAKNLCLAFSRHQDRLYCIGQLVSLISQILSTVKSEPNADSQTQAVKQYIQENLSGDLSVSILSRHFQISESGLKHKFRRETGYTLCDYVNRNRIMHSRTLLLQGMNITQAAIQSGFNSSDYFTTVFKKYTMQTPTEFVRSIHNE